MKTTINTRNHGKVTFSRPGYEYVYVNLNGKPGTLGQQICYGGWLVGNTVIFSGNDEKAFARYCRNWWKQYLRREKEWG